MAITNIANVRIAGISSVVPRNILDISDVSSKFGTDEAKKICSSVGVNKRHISFKNTCTSDLCFAAAENILSKLHWDRESIDTLLFVSQTPDYILPATSCSLHGRLNLSKHCAAFDINLGCSGYVYGMWVASQLISGGHIKRILLLVGDTSSKLISDEDKSAYPLFGDAGTATALEYDPMAEEMVFVLGTDGEGAEHLIVPSGAFRSPKNEFSAKRSKHADGNIRNAEELYMNGAEIFTFTLREVPTLINNTLHAKGWTIEGTDAFVFHQANIYILNHLAKRMKIPAEKFAVSMEEYGNTSSSSIPLTLTASLRSQLTRSRTKLVLAGFGVGLSWGAVALSIGPGEFPEIAFLN